MKLPWWIKMNKDMQVRDGKLIVNFTVRKIYIVYLYVVCVFELIKQTKFKISWNK
jgi:hypothetical protein